MSISSLEKMCIRDSRNEGEIYDYQGDLEEVSGITGKQASFRDLKDIYLSDGTILFTEDGYEQNGMQFLIVDSSYRGYTIYGDGKEHKASIEVSSGVSVSCTLEAVSYTHLFGNKKLTRYFSMPVKSLPRKEDSLYVHKMEEPGLFIYLMCSKAQRFVDGEFDLRDMVDIWLYYRAVVRGSSWKYIMKQLGLSLIHI